MVEHGVLPVKESIDPPVRMYGVTFSQIAMRPPFNVQAPSAEDWRLYMVRAENVVMVTADTGGKGELLPKGTIIGMSGKIAHSFQSAFQSAFPSAFPSAENAGDYRPAVDWIETPLGSKTVSGAVVLAMSRISQASMPFISMFGACVRIDPEAHGDVAARIGAMLDWITDETLRDEPATGSIIMRLAEIIVIEIGRISHAQNLLFSERPREAEYDPRIWRAMAAISKAPQHHWTVETMAQVAGMSRSAFAVRYHETVGQTPMRSLRRLRMHRAATALASPGPQVIAPLADAVGYGSDAAFNRAFAKEFGHPPRRYGLNSADRSNRGPAA